MTDLILTKMKGLEYLSKCNKMDRLVDNADEEKLEFIYKNAHYIFHINDIKTNDDIPTLKRKIDLFKQTKRT